MVVVAKISDLQVKFVPDRARLLAAPVLSPAGVPNKVWFGAVHRSTTNAGRWWPRVAASTRICCTACSPLRGCRRQLAGSLLYQKSSANSCPLPLGLGSIGLDLTTVGTGRGAITGAKGGLPAVNKLRASS